jgi:hypothetical protein
VAKCPSNKHGAFVYQAPHFFRSTVHREEVMISRLFMDILPQNLHRWKVLDLGFPAIHRLPHSAEYQ